MSVNLNVSDFSAELFTLDQDNQPVDNDQFLKGLNVLASQALGVLMKHEDVELAFHQIERVNLIDLASRDKENIDQRINDVLKGWVKVTFGNHSRHIPRERLAKHCGPKFQAQYTSEMKEASDRELDLQSADPSSVDGCPEDCKELFLVYLQAGAIPPGALGESALEMLVLAEQQQLEGLAQQCLDFLIENLSHENLDTFLEFTQQSPFPRLELACLNFMKDNRSSLSEELKTKYPKELLTLEKLKENRSTITATSSGKFKVEVGDFTERTTDLLQTINKQFPIASLVLASTCKNPFSSLLQFAPTLEDLQELFIYNETPTDSDLPKLKNLFPNLAAIQNDAPFLKTFDEVHTYLGNFRNLRKPEEDEQESKKPLLRSLNLKAIPDLTDFQLAMLTPYFQELHHLVIESDKMTSVVAPKASWVDCTGCTYLTTLEMPEATEIYCCGCTRLTTIKAPKALSVWCRNCEHLAILEAPEAKTFNIDGCIKLKTLKAPKAIEVLCNYCSALSLLDAPKATMISLEDTALTTLNAPNARLQGQPRSSCQIF